jgi:hypothetical protein
MGLWPIESMKGAFARLEGLARPELMDEASWQLFQRGALFASPDVWAVVNMWDGKRSEAANFTIMETPGGNCKHGNHSITGRKVTFNVDADQHQNNDTVSPRRCFIAPTGRPGRRLLTSLLCNAPVAPTGRQDRRLRLRRR